MANAWNGTIFTNIAEKGISAFNKGLAVLGAFTTDFSTEAAEQGTTVTTRIVPVSGAAVDMSDAGNLTGSVPYNREDASVTEDTTTTAKSVVLSKAYARGFHLTDAQAGEIGSGVWADTVVRLIEQKAYAVAVACVKDVLDLIVPATFTNTPIFTGAAASYDMDDVADAGELASQLGWGLDGRTTMVLDTAYATSLKKDNAIQDLSASGISVVQDGELRKLDRFGVMESPIMRDATTFYTGQNGRGFMARPEAMMMAFRPIVPQAPELLVHYEILEDPSGVVLAYRVHYNTATGTMYHTFETLFGTAAGQATALSLLKSA